MSFFQNIPCRPNCFPGSIPCRPSARPPDWHKAIGIMSAAGGVGLVCFLSFAVSMLFAAHNGF